MTRWASNTTWLEFQGSKSPKKRVKRARHVVLGLRHVVLGLQHDVARAQRVRTPKKEAKKSAPCRIGAMLCRVGPPTRRGSAPRVRITPKGSKTSAPRRIVSPPCRVGPPTRRGSTPKAPNHSKREQNKRATSYWECAMPRWASNATWLPHARLHHTETGTDKRWRSHFGSKRGGLCGVGGNI